MEGDNDMQDDDPSEDRVRRSGGANNGEDMNDEPELNGYQRWVVLPCFLVLGCIYIYSRVLPEKECTLTIILSALLQN
jgi:hypothetical protein